MKIYSILFSKKMIMRLVSTAFCLCSSVAFSPSLNKSRRSLEKKEMAAVASKDVEEDKYIWLEDVEAEECLDFAKSSNEKCLKALGDPKLGPTYDRVLAVLESEDRIPYVSSYGRNEQGERILFNFWKDKSNPKGIWRKTTMEEYKKENPNWEVVLDVDKLAEKDGISWVWKGSKALPRSRDPESDDGRIVSRTLLSLSRGGADATHLKEFDMLTQDFVAEGEAFILPEAKTRASYKSRDVLLVGSDFGEGSLTDSGYPRVVKEWARGMSIEDAPIIFEGEKTDVAVNAYVADERSWGGKLQFIFDSGYVSLFSSTITNTMTGFW
jgi:prolyl oligopeptidase